MAQRTKQPILQLKVRGPGVRTGRIAVPDLIRICQEAQNAVNRQAEAIEGRKTIHPGPITKSIQEECTLELVGIGRGSTTLKFALAHSQMKLDESESFGIEVIEELAATIKALGTGNRKKEIDEGVLQGIYGLGSVIAGRRISEFQWIAPKSGKKRSKIVAPITKTVQDRVAERLSRPRRTLVTIDGILEMADFKPKDRKCRIDPAIGPSVLCSFSQDQENMVYSLLRKPVRITGEASLLPYNEKIESVSIQTVQPLPSLELGEGIFFGENTLAELAKMQDVGPLKDISKLAGGIPQDEDLDEFLKDIYDSRNSATDKRE